MKATSLVNWTSKVKKRDNYTCQECGSITLLQAHHINNDPELSLEIDNGITLCFSCHSKKRINPKNIISNSRTTDNIFENIGKQATAMLEGLRVSVIIINFKQSYGRIDYKIQPIGSPDSKYINSSKVRIEE